MSQFTVVESFTAIIDDEEKFFDVGDTMSADDESACSAHEKGLVERVGKKKKVDQ